MKKKFQKKAKASALDVARYILRKQGPMSAMKLQKLVYYCQAWSLVFDGRPMFREAVEAWVHGPVIRALYAKHRGKFEVSIRDIPGNNSNLDTDARDTIDAVLRVYGGQSPFTLRLITHKEPPWKNAREGLKSEDPGYEDISLESMYNYYSTLVK